jgi:hypothetical protein
MSFTVRNRRRRFGMTSPVVTALLSMSHESKCRAVACGRDGLR